MNCYTKEEIIDVLGKKKTILVGERKIIPTCLISATTTFDLIKDVCEPYLANIIDMIKFSPGVMDVPVVREFLDVFLYELSGLPLYREVNFKIETILRAASTSIALYKMAPLELKELKKQLEELLEKGFIKPSTSP